MNNVCSLCTADPQKVAIVITNHIKSSEVSYHQLLLVSNHDDHFMAVHSQISVSVQVKNAKSGLY